MQSLALPCRSRQYFPGSKSRDELRAEKYTDYFLYRYPCRLLIYHLQSLLILASQHITAKHLKHYGANVSILFVTSRYF